MPTTAQKTAKFTDYHVAAEDVLPQGSLARVLELAATRGDIVVQIREIQPTHTANASR